MTLETIGQMSDDPIISLPAVALIRPSETSHGRLTVHLKTAQEQGVGIVAYNRKEGRGFGEVVKYLVYNARRNAAFGDCPDGYFAGTEEIAGVQDVRFQELSINVVHWLGVGRIDRWVSMSHHKYQASIDTGIEVVRQIELPNDLSAAEAEVEISAKKSAGYFTQTHVNGPNRSER
ncbi:hypothetical protein [Pararhizobium sp. PWRC1-1]|uniref:hypothetical protein n=1 Tax=Pararhizobium sp. PWRC1-1 TaxID=2804566 RepID=UPI003CF2EDC8